MSIFAEEAARATSAGKITSGCYVKHGSDYQCKLKPQFQVNDDKSCCKHLPQLVKLASSEMRTPVVIVEMLL